VRGRRRWRWHPAACCLPSAAAGLHLSLPGFLCNWYLFLRERREANAAILLFALILGVSSHLLPLFPYPARDGLPVPCHPCIFLPLLPPQLLLHVNNVRRVPPRFWRDALARGSLATPCARETA